MLPHTGLTVTVHKHGMSHPSVREEPPRSLGEQYQYTTVPDPALTSPLLPCPHILILFGLPCQATVSVNTAPGNFNRKPPQLCGKLDAITARTPICSDNWMAVCELPLRLCSFVLLAQENTCLVIVYILWKCSYYPNNPQTDLPHVGSRSSSWL